MIHTTQECRIGDARDLLPETPDATADTVITSPPYWGLRDYGVEGQIGLEPTFKEYHEHLLEVTAELYRVLKPTGVMFWNHGDSYGGSASQGFGGKGGTYADMSPHGRKRPKIVDKCLTMQNERLIMRMIDEQGWILRNRIIWEKPNAMPSSVTDRFSNKYEPVYMLVKSKKYWFDLDAVRVPHKDASAGRWCKGGEDTSKTKFNKSTPDTAVGNLQNASNPLHPLGKNPGDVWTISTQPYPESHFACVDEETKVLTMNGWKMYNEVTLDDEIATFDTITEKIHYHKPYNIHIFDYNGRMLRIQNQWIDQMVTPNHRVLLKYMHSTQKKHPDTNWQYVNADEIRPYSGILIPNAGIYDGIYSINEHKAELLGWILSEGHIQTNGAITIYQSKSVNPMKVDRIRYLLNVTNQQYVYSERTRDYNGRDSIEASFRLNKTQNDNSWIFEWVDNKKNPSWKLLHLKHGELSALFNGLVDGDGHRRPDGRVSFIQNNEYVQHWFRTLCVHLNARTTLHKNTRVSSKQTTHVTQRNNSQIHQSDFKECVEWVDYEGIVWCPEVPNTNFVCMRNGKICITGNTFPTALIEPMTKAACPAEICLVCRMARERIVDREFVPQQDVSAENGVRGALDQKPMDASNQWQGFPRGTTAHHAIGWTDCGCGAGWIAGTVLDPFCGSGTVLEVCRRLNRNAIGFELNPEYEPLIHERSMAHTPPLTAYFNE